MFNRTPRNRPLKVGQLKLLHDGVQFTVNRWLPFCQYNRQFLDRNHTSRESRIINALLCIGWYIDSVEFTPAIFLSRTTVTFRFVAWDPSYPAPLEGTLSRIYAKHVHYEARKILRQLDNH